MLTETRTVEEIVDQSLVGALTLFGEKSFELLRFGWQAGQNKRSTTREC